MLQEFNRFDPGEWSVRSAEIIQKSVEAGLRERGKCSVLLTGGRSAGKLYAAWAGLGAFGRLAGVSFYFGDERCVLPDHPESNYGAAMGSLFVRGVPRGCSVFRMEADDPDREAAARRYGELLPDKLDVLLFGVGEDGHIASMFPRSESLREIRRKVVPVIGPKPPRERLTVTPPVIELARSVFVLASGADKASVLVKALQEPGNIDALPARLVLKATWLMDTPLIGESH
jgi:6-phosphogluconolactonase